MAPNVTQGHMQNEMFVHKSGVYVTGEGAKWDSSFGLFTRKLGGSRHTYS